MKQTMKRLLSFAFILILVMSLAVPAFAADDAVTPREGSMTVQMNAKKNGTVMVQLASGYKNFTINRADVRSRKEPPAQNSRSLSGAAAPIPAPCGA